MPWRRVRPSGFNRNRRPPVRPYVCADLWLKACVVVRLHGMNNPSIDPTKPAASRTEPVTLSWPTGLARRGRLLAAVKGTSLSKLVADLLDDATKEGLPKLLADL